MGNGEDVMTTYTSSSDPPAVERDGTYVHCPAVEEAKWVLGGGREGYRPRSFAGKRERERDSGEFTGLFYLGEMLYVLRRSLTSDPPVSAGT